jgi:2-oxo-4-hydroxy-4-carboxy-5-ureidoimidazoline decarboxylase
MAYTLFDLNQMSQTEFVTALGDIFEQTPVIAELAWQQHPFSSFEELYQRLVDVVINCSPDDQLALIRAHPDLGSKVKMAAASVQEQAGAGLDRLSPDEYEQFQSLNQAYKIKFGFPFIIAVKNHSKTSILQAFEQRLQHSIAAEREQALHEIFQIAHFRLRDRVRAIK